MDQLAQVLKEIISEHHHQHHQHHHGMNNNYTDIRTSHTMIKHMDSSSILLKCSDEDEDYVAIKDKIIAHPNFHDLLIAYVNCQKVGAPPQVVKKLDDLIHASCIMQNNKYSSLTTLRLQQDSIANCNSSTTDPDLHHHHHHHTSINSCDQYHLHQITTAGDNIIAESEDPELDDFMDAYCGLLQRYHEELSKPLDEAMAFLADIKLQVSKSADKGDDDYDRYYPHGGLMEDLMDSGLRPQLDDICDEEYDEDEDEDDESYN